MIGNGLGTIQYPKISTSSDKIFAKKITLHYTAISFWLSLLALLIINLLPADFYSALFGKDFEEIKTIFLILSPGIFFLNLQNTLCFYFNGLSLYLINTIGALIGLGTFVLLAALNYKGGIYNLCLAVSISYIILYIYMLYQFNKNSGSTIRELFHYLGQPKKILRYILEEKNDSSL